jgi:hypothetical protein
MKTIVFCQSELNFIGNFLKKITFRGGGRFSLIFMKKINARDVMLTSKQNYIIGETD